MADTNGLLAALDKLADAPPAVRGPRCTVGNILEALDDATARKVREVLDTPTITSTQIADTLTASGHTVQSPAVARHRRRGSSNGCRCAR
ncbi:hypothetical protein ACWDZ4_20540 [Streptomyces sp. NPDC003016]